MTVRQAVWIVGMGVLLAGLGSGLAAGRDYPIRPVPFTEVRMTDAFWAPRIETNRTVTIPYAFAKCEENGRMDNFLLAAGQKEGEHQGTCPVREDARQLLLSCLDEGDVTVLGMFIESLRSNMTTSTSG